MSDDQQYPIIDLSVYLNDPKNASTDCNMVADLLHKYGFLCVKDPRVDDIHNKRFIDMLEKYYEQSDEEKAKDIHDEVFYQVGLTSTYIERARNHCDTIAKLDRTEKALSICPPELDNKMRFFWRVGEAPSQSEYPQLHADPVIPEKFSEWKTIMDSWGKLMLESVLTVAQMCALGFGLPVDTFTSLMKYGPHLLAPTGSDLGRFGKEGTVLAGFHSDIGFLTIHGRARFPGLFVWTREGKRLAVKVSHGCLLLQAGKQFEWLTGGEVLAGFHEVIVSEKTVEVIDDASKAGRSLWRVSSTMFTHIASDEILKPLPTFANSETLEKYSPMKAGAQVLAELAAINMKKTLN
ncbi:hypothetical protein I4U23_004231 [Adineta vaga]|nr:hypothetical protein I4U23_004231 [Adineta vaga]